jgi:mannitol/fructose-specific phosphotransferase system IIA component (Ntr-type)
MSASPSEASTILEMLSPKSIKVPFAVSNKQEAIDGLIDVLAEHGHITDPAEMKHVVWERENQRSTGIGEGFAIPHGKTTNTNRLVLAIGIPTEPIEFDSIDGEPVKLLALLLSPSDKIAEHIQALGRISRLMKDEDFRETAFSAQTPEELYDHIKGLQD